MYLLVSLAFALFSKLALIAPCVMVRRMSRISCIRSIIQVVLRVLCYKFVDLLRCFWFLSMCIWLWLFYLPWIVVSCVSIVFVLLFQGVLSVLIVLVVLIFCISCIVCVCSIFQIVLFCLFVLVRCISCIYCISCNCFDCSRCLNCSPCSKYFYSLYYLFSSMCHFFLLFYLCYLFCLLRISCVWFHFVMLYYVLNQFQVFLSIVLVFVLFPSLF